jgi:sarcosine oxidase subunit alpha
VSAGPYRLATGGRIDRHRSLRFSLDGTELEALGGDTVASALLANGIRLVGRSFKLHRPRGIVGAGVEEPNALLTEIRPGGCRVPNLQATVLEACDGLRLESQNRWPALTFDLQSVNGMIARFLPAGFYYKTFMGPGRRGWMWYEPWIRRSAGLGRAATLPDPDRYDSRECFCDVLVIGAGPAGVGAARAAADLGARVTLVHRGPMAGGGLLATAAGGDCDRWLEARIADLDRCAAFTRLPRATAFGLYDGNTVGVIEDWAGTGHNPRQRLSTVRAGAVVFATGALERPLVFAGNDRPGVMLAGAARRYANHYGVAVGRAGVLVTDNDSAYAAAADLARVGIRIVLCDLRAGADPEHVRQAEAEGVEVRPASAVIDIVGGRSVRAAVVAPIDGDANRIDRRATKRLPCDFVASSGGWTPTVHLTSHLGTPPRWRDDIAAFVAGALGPSCFAAGAVCGEFDTRRAHDEGVLAGREAARAAGRATAAQSSPDPPPLLSRGPVAFRLSPPVPAPRRSSKRFVDLQNDVTVDDVDLARREGYDSVEHLKRYTTLGMGTDQGRTSNLNALARLADLRGQPVAALGTTTFRPPFVPVAVGTFAGRAVGARFRPRRLTPMHDWHVANGAEMIEAGAWMRPWFYRGNGADAGTAYIREMEHVRRAAGLMDISTLGKIDVAGPDAAEFLDRVYVNGFGSLRTGRARYGVMLRDDGLVLDDGTVSRIAERRYFMTTTSAQAGRVMTHLEMLLDCAWPELRVRITSVTDQWAGMSIAGPHLDAILGAAFPALDLYGEAFPPMAVLDGSWQGIPLRFIRVSYSGERACELFTPAGHGLALWQHLIATGREHGLEPYGVEALGALRIEAGHVGGPELDGRTTLSDLGLERMASTKKHFVGRAMAGREALLDPDRRRLVGLATLNGARLRSGAILFGRDEPRSGHGRGHVTSSTFSPALGRFIALGLLAGGMVHEGREMVACFPLSGDEVPVRVVFPRFLDSEGAGKSG